MGSLLCWTGSDAYARNREGGMGGVGERERYEAMMGDSRGGREAFGPFVHFDGQTF